MKLTNTEKVKITRWRLGMQQAEFYRGVCDQQTGSYLENGNWKGDPERVNKIAKAIRNKYDCEPKDINAGEMIKIMRIRLGIKVKRAMEMFNTNKVSQIRIECGKKDDYKQLRTYQKIDKEIS